jgi:ubiquitin carboxyl-terminal hydrolase 7
LYTLYGVLVHSGDLHGGHYQAFLRPGLAGNQEVIGEDGKREARWLKYDDDRVIPVTDKEVYEDNFGGDGTNVKDVVIGPQPLKPSPRVMKRITNAYMLVYVRNADIETVLGEVTEADIPTHLSMYE